MEMLDAFINAFTGPEPWAHPLVKYYLSALVALYPAWRICRRAGFSGAAAGLLALPFFGFVILTVWLALRRWPAREGVTA